MKASFRHTKTRKLSAYLLVLFLTLGLLPAGNLRATSAVSEASAVSAASGVSVTSAPSAAAGTSAVTVASPSSATPAASASAAAAGTSAATAATVAPVAPVVPASSTASAASAPSAVSPSPSPSGASGTSVATNKVCAIEIINDALSKEDGAPWTGALADAIQDKKPEVAWHKDLTAQEALETYAKARNFKVTFTQSTFGAYLTGINGLSGQKPAGAEWGAWMFSVNGVAPNTGAGKTVLAAGDKLTFYYVVGLPSVKVDIKNDVFAKKDGAPWEGTLKPKQYYETVSLMLPQDKAPTAEQILNRYAAQNGFKLVFGKAQDGTVYVESVNALSIGMTFPAPPRKASFVLDINGKTAAGSLDKIQVKPGDKLTLAFAFAAAPTVPTVTTQPSATTTENNAPLPEVSAFWPSFRGSDDNRAVREMTSSTPRFAEETQLMWTRQFGDFKNWTGFPSQPIVIGGHVVFVHGRTLEALNQDTGATVWQITLPDDQQYASTAPLYAEGRIFVPLNNGTVAAYRADNGEHLWTYTDKNGGQCQSPLTFSDGLVYAAFWNKETPASLVALNAGSGKAAWSFELREGFYWAGAAVLGNYLVLGADDGNVRVFNKKTGDLTDSLKLDEKIRSTVAVYDGRLYAAGTKGNIASFTLDSEGKISEALRLQLGVPVTATILPSGDCLYIPSMEACYVVSLSSGKLARKVSLPGYAQGSPLLVSSGKNDYIYLTTNQEPGSILVFKGGLQGPAEGEDQAKVLYTPQSPLQNYCIASPIMLANGFVLHRNDSGAFFALARKSTTPVTPVTTETTTAAPTTAPSGSSSVPAVTTTASPTEKPTAVPSTVPAGTTAPAANGITQTGESGLGWLLGILFIVVAAGLVVVVLILRRRSRDDEEKDN